MNRPGYLRFDFNYTEQLSQEQLEEIALITNQAVDQHFPVHTIETSLEKAKEMGAMALFGENYGSEVRVVEMGGPFSIELCGGTHVANTSEIGPVSVLGESSVGSGARRIEAYSGLDAFRYYSKETALVEGVSRELKVQTEDLPERIAQLTEKLKAAEKQIADLHKAQLMSQTADMIAGATDVNGFSVVAAKLPNGVNGGDLRTLASDIKNRLGDVAGIVALASENEGGKMPFIVAATKAANERGVKAGNLVKTISGYVDGKGGGKPDMAQGSGATPAGLDAAFNAVRDELSAL